MLYFVLVSVVSVVVCFCLPLDVIGGLCSAITAVPVHLLLYSQYPKQPSFITHGSDITFCIDGFEYSGKSGTNNKRFSYAIGRL